MLRLRRRCLTAQDASLCVAALALSVACSAGERTTSPPPSVPGGGPSDSAGAAQRGTLEVQITVDPDDAAIGAGMGLDAAAPRGITVTLVRDGSGTEAPRTRTTDTNGVARFDGLLEGRYQISADRAVSVAERRQLPTDAADITALAGGATTTIVPGANSVAVSLVAGRAGSVVISEIWAYRPRLPSGGEYSDGGYVEFYNNADTTVYLDGMLFGALPRVSEGRVPLGPAYDYCTVYRDIRRDSTRLPFLVLTQFPGTGREYPLAPGRAVVVAQDAIDHGEFAPGSLNLSGADFEFIGDTRDVDNPAVPNMRNILSATGPFGRGFRVGAFLPDAYLLAQRPSGALETQTVDPTSGFASTIMFVPRESVLDAAFLYKSPEARAFLAALGIRQEDCPDGWHAVWERAPARIFDLGAHEFSASSYVRRAAFTRPDGRVVLQRTRASARDWVYGASPTPGFVRSHF